MIDAGDINEPLKIKEPVKRKKQKPSTTRLRKDGKPWGHPDPPVDPESPKKGVKTNGEQKFTGAAKKGEVRNKYGFYGKAGREGTLRMINYARGYTKLAIETLVDIAKDRNALDGARVSAATEILNRGHGRAKETIELTGADGGPVEFAEYEKGKESIMLKLFGDSYSIRKQKQQEDDTPPPHPMEDEDDEEDAIVDV